MRKKRLNWRRRLRILLLLKLGLKTMGMQKEQPERRMGNPQTNRDQDALCRSMPGKTPISVPTRQPTSAKPRLAGVSAMLNPTNARDLGLHSYDGKVAAISKEALDARVARLHQAADDLARTDGKGLSDDEALRISLITCRIRMVF